MAHAKISVNPDQGELITFLPLAGVEVVADVYAAPKPEDGPSVDLLTRGVHLGNALVALGNASKLTGLEIASDTPGLRRGLERRYDDVDALTGNASVARGEHMSRAKKAFAHASGHHELVAADPANKEAIQQQSRQMYSDFIKTFADSKGAQKRREMQRVLKRQQTMLSQNRSRGRVE